LHRFDTDHERDRQTDGRLDDGYDEWSILLSRAKIRICVNKKKTAIGYVSLVISLNIDVVSELFHWHIFQIFAI